MENPGGVEVLTQEFNQGTRSSESLLEEVAHDIARIYSSEDILRFTSNFAEKIGSSTVGDVYKGFFPNGVDVAVKVIVSDVDEWIFMSEMQSLSKLYHRSVNKLLGFCFEKDMKALVWEYCNNGSLDMLLSKKDNDIEFAKFYDIAIQIAKGMSYLHYGCDQEIIHYNLKPSNILLKGNLCVRITDAGLHKFSDGNSNRPIISQHYTSPEMYSASSDVTSQSDVYSFGMILFEIARTAADGKGNCWFPEIAWDEFENSDKRKTRILSMVALWCVQFTPEARPSMATVARVLEQEILVSMPPNPFLPADPLESTMQPLHEVKEIFSSRVDVPQKLMSVCTQRNKASLYPVSMLLSELKFEKTKRYSFDELATFTSNFDNEIGTGAFGNVYSGKFSDGIEIAVKVLKMDDFVQHSFLTEIRTIGKTDHQNVIKLFGFCLAENMLALVYEYMEKGSLDMVLYKKLFAVQWDKFYAIAVEIATALAYLHHGCRDEIIHHDIKAANVLLDSNLSPKLADFGLANLKDKDRTHLTMTKIKGTPGYAAPEIWTPFSPITCKCDVYGFGMILFEILGRERNDREDIWFPRHVWEQFNRGKLDTLIMECGISEKDKKKATILSVVALWCAQFTPRARPSMSMVGNVLQNEILVNWPPDPFMPSNLSMQPADNS